MTKAFLSIDLNTIRMTKEIFDNMIKDISTSYEIIQMNLYNFIQEKHSQYSLLDNTVVSLYQGGRKRVQLNMEQALDTAEFAIRNGPVSIFLICGELGSDILIDKLHKFNNQVTIINENQWVSKADKQIRIQRIFSENPIKIDAKSTNSQKSTIDELKLQELINVLNTNKSDILKEKYEELLKKAIK